MTLPLALSSLLLLSAHGQQASTAPATAQPEAQEVRAAVEGTVNAILEVLKDKSNDREARRRKIYAVMDGVADFALMGKLTLGPEHWAKFDEAQRKEFLEAFAAALRASTFDKLDIYTDETVTYDAPAPADKKKYAMPVRIRSRGDIYVAVFKLYKPKTAWKVYDVEVEGISLIRTYKGQYDQVLQKGSPRDLLDKMKSKALATPDEFKKLGEAKPGQEKKP